MNTLSPITPFPQDPTIREDAKILLNDLGLGRGSEEFFQLTEEGQSVAHLPLSYAAAAALVEARTMGKLPQLLPLVAMIHTQDIRYRPKETVTQVLWESSDLVRQVCLVAQLEWVLRQDATQFETQADALNISSSRLKIFHRTLRMLERATRVTADYRPYMQTAPNPLFDRDVKQVLFRSSGYRIYPLLYGYTLKVPNQEMEGRTMTTARISDSSVVKVSAPAMLFVTGCLRVVHALKNHQPISIVDQITAYTADDMTYLIARFGDIWIKDEILRYDETTALSSWYDTRDQIPEISPKRSIAEVAGDTIDRIVQRSESIIPGSFADLLNKALSTQT